MNNTEYLQYIDRLKGIVSELVRMDVSFYRIKSHELTGKYQHEPSNYRNDLTQIYTNMNENDLIKLYQLKILKS